MKRYLIILALCGAAYADSYSERDEEQARQRQAELEERAEELQARINAQNSTVIISEGVSRDVQVITPGQVIDLRK